MRTNALLLAVVTCSLLSGCRCGDRSERASSVAAPVVPALPFDAAAALAAGEAIYVLADVDALVSEYSAGGGGTVEENRAAAADLLRSLAGELPEALEGRVNFEALSDVAVALTSDGQGFAAVAPAAVLDAELAAGTERTQVGHVELAVRGDYAIIGTGAPFERALDGETARFDASAAWPEAVANIPERASILALDLAGSANEVARTFGFPYTRAMLAGGGSAAVVTGFETDDPMAVSHALGGSQAELQAALTGARRGAPPALVGWIDYAELATRALWSQVSLTRDGNVSWVRAAAPTCPGFAQALVYPALMFGFAPEGPSTTPFQAQEAAIAETCAPYPGPAASLPTGLAGAAGSSVDGERAVLLADLGAVLRANVTTGFGLLPFALRAEDVAAALGPAPLGLAGLEDAAGDIGLYVDLGTRQGFLALPPGARGVLPIPVPPGFDNTVVPEVGWVVATPGGGAAATTPLDDDTAWARALAALDGDAAVVVLGTRSTMAEFVGGASSESALVANAQLLGAALSAELELSFVAYVADGAPALAEGARDEIVAAAASRGEIPSEMLETFAAAVSVRAVGDDVVVVQVGRSAAESRTLLSLGLGLGAAVSVFGQAIPEPPSRQPTLTTP